MIEIILIAAWVFLAGAIWMLFCNDRTYKQRQEMLSSMEPGSPHFWDHMAIFNTVTYHEHLWALAKFKDPYSLYTVPYHVVAIREEA